MVKADLITGFLGAGKTTFIREYVKYLNSIGERVCILENDYGAINVDMMLLSDLQSDRLGLEMVAGGCDYDCHLRRFKTKMITMAMLGYDRVIVEPSGIFDVDEFFDVLHEDRLSSMYEIGNVLTIVDADMEELSDEGQYMLGGMVACAGKIILSRVQEVDEACISRTVEALNKILSKVSCKRVLGDKDILVKDWSLLEDHDFEMIVTAGYNDVGYVKHFSMDESGFDSLFFMNPTLNLEELKGVITDLFERKDIGRIIRIKGFLRDVYDQWVEVNATGNSLRIGPVKAGQRLVIVIGEMLDEEVISSLIPSEYSTYGVRENARKVGGSYE